MQEAVVIRTDEQLAQIVRLGSILRMPRLELMLHDGVSFGSMDGLVHLASRELARCHENLQLNYWRIAAKEGPGGTRCRIVTDYFDAGADRLFVRRRVYARAMALCIGGRPSPEAVCRAVRQDIAYGTAGANPHCVSSALRSGTGVCQAISHYVFQLMVRCGYPCVVRTGTLGGVRHSWNRIRLHGAWQTVDLCVSGPAEYLEETAETAQQQYDAMTVYLHRRVRLHERGADVNGIPFPQHVADRRWVCPTRFVQCFNGASFRDGDSLILCMGAAARSVPFSALRETPEHIPYMETAQFARLMGLRMENDCLLFAEGL